MRKSFLLVQELSTWLKDFGQEHQIDIEKLLLAAFAVLLHRTQEHNEVVIAVPKAQFTPGQASNKQRWQISFSPSSTVRQLLRDLQSRSGDPTLTVSERFYFSYESPELLMPDHPESLCLRIEQCNEIIEGNFCCADGLFSESDLELFASRYPVILNGMLAGDDQICSQMPLLTDTEKQQVLDWREDKISYPRDVCLHTLIEWQVERTPDAVAISYQGHNITYRELNERANQIAHLLIQKNIGPEALVGLYTDPAPDMISAMLGILKTGAAYVCLDPVYPRQTLKLIAEECDLSWLMTTDSLERTFPVRGTPVLLLDDPRLKEQPTTNPALSLASELPAFIVYTSGSTGKPKGVIHTHRNLISRFHSTWAFTPTGAEEVYSQTSPLSSIDLIDELYPPLMRGYRIQMLDMSVVRDPNLLVRALEEARVTRMILVPSLLRTILSTEIDLAHSLHTLKTILIGGEPLTYALVDLFYQKLPHAQLVNFYGLTEGDGAYYRVPPEERISFAPPVGRPVANAKIYILDPNLQPMPVGMPGEIYIANEGMARGYFKRPDLDAQRFLPNPFNAALDACLYKTGDRGRFLPDGNIEYLGRMDRMVKIRSFRVELGEVEAALNSHPEVRECYVMARQPSETEESLTRVVKLVAYVVLKNPHSIAAQTLKAYLQDRLPDYARPGSIMLLESFPLAPTGKIDAAALPDPEQQPRELDENYVSPRDPLETQLTRMWERILRTSPIGIHDNFFDIGGDSLNAVDLFLQIEKEMHKDLPISTLMQAPTIETLASLIRQDSGFHSWSSLVPIQPSGTALPLFCIHANGGVIVYKAFPQFLGLDQPVYGLQARGLLGTKEAPHTNIVQMAADYIKEIRTVQPRGPYQMCAFSMGGVVAFEMACQLRAAGEEVAFLGLLDSYGPGYPQQKPGANILQLKLSRHWSVLAQYGLPQKLDYLRNRSRRRIAKIQSALLGWLFVTLRIPMPHRIRYEYVKQINEEATEKYVPSKYPGTLTIFRALVQPSGVVDNPYLGWKGHAEKIEIVDVIGTHATIMRTPDLGKLVDQVKRHLRLPHAAREIASTQEPNDPILHFSLRSAGAGTSD